MTKSRSMRLLAVLALAFLAGPQLAVADDLTIQGFVKSAAGKPISMIKVSAYQDAIFLNRAYTDEQGRYEMTVPGGHATTILFDTHPTLTNARMWHPSVVLNAASRGTIALDRTLVPVGETGGSAADIDAFMAYQFATVVLESHPGELGETYAQVALARLSELKLPSQYLQEAYRGLMTFLSGKR
jgi:hypothetical protein